MKLRDFFKDLTPAKIAERDAKIKRDREKYEARPVVAKSATVHEVVQEMIDDPGKVLITAVQYPDFLTVQDMETLFDPNRVRSCEREEKKFVINICPMGAPRMNRSVKWKPNKAQLRYFAFKDALRAAVGSPPVPDELHITAHFPMFQTWSKKRRQQMDGQPHRTRCDADNAIKAIQDSLFPEDCGIWNVSCKKFWCQQGQERLELTLVYYYKKKGCAQSGS